MIRIIVFNIIFGTLVLTMSGCSTLNSETYAAAEKVKVVDVSFMTLGGTTNCQKLGSISGNSAGEAGGKKAAIKHLKVNANKLGANVVVSSLQFEKTAGFFAPADTVSGMALKCADDVYAKAATIDDVFQL